MMNDLDGMVFEMHRTQTAWQYKRQAITMNRHIIDNNGLTRKGNISAILYAPPL